MTHLSILSTFGKQHPQLCSLSLSLSLTESTRSLTRYTWPEPGAPSRTCTVSPKISFFLSFLSFHFLPLLSLSRNGFCLDCEKDNILSIYFIKLAFGDLLFSKPLNGFIGKWVKNENFFTLELRWVLLGVEKENLKDGALCR
jgi:hypothetical protein